MWLEEATKQINSLDLASFVSPAPSPNKETLIGSRENSVHSIRNRSHSAFNAQYYNHDDISTQSTSSSVMNSPKQWQSRKTSFSRVQMAEANNFSDVENGMGS